MSKPEEHPFLHEQEALLPAPNYGHVADLIRTEIAASGPITYARWMELEMYGRSALPEEGQDLEAQSWGFYSSGHNSIGGQARRDFVTHVEDTPAFGMSIAHWVHDVWQRSGQPNPFYLIESGAGNGTLMRDSTRELSETFPALAAVVRPVILEYAAGMIAKQRARAQSPPGMPPVSWVYGSAVDFPLRNVPGAFVSNELPDAFPVHRIVKYAEGFREMYVNTNRDGAFFEQEGPMSSLELQHAAEAAYNAQPMNDGEVRIINLKAEQWMRRMAGALAIGGILTLDYGPDDQVITSPLRVFGRQTVSTNSGFRWTSQFRFPGAVDITGNVPFGLLDKIATDAGLETDFAGAEFAFLQKHGFTDHQARVAARTPEGPQRGANWERFMRQRERGKLGQNVTYETFIRHAMEQNHYFRALAHSKIPKTPATKIV